MLATPGSTLAVSTALLATRSARCLATAPRAIAIAARTLRACASRFTKRAFPHGRIHVEALGRDDRHLLLQKALDLAKMFLLLRRHKRDRFTGCARASRTTDAMDVVF
ncbi:MAG TPA: hypothetical protein VLI21_07560, partial [Casimicrobiaceae bacterium]|nr:hypothetical protein [Casimicrobiaceae bacterium]